jgi:hypothetical protein
MEVYNALPHPTSDRFLVILDGGDLKGAHTPFPL